MDLIKHLEHLNIKFEGLLRDLSNPVLIGNPIRFREMQREHSRLAPVIQKFTRYKKLSQEKGELEGLLTGNDRDMVDLARGELPAIEKSLTELESDLQIALLPRDPNEDRNAILEIRAGTGGDEAGLFAGDLLRMYMRYAEEKNWRLETLESSTSERGGVKEVIVQVSGPAVWSHLKYESGVHRVQRVPTTEASGRIHTSTATVAVLSEAEEVDIKIDPSDLRIDTYRASGAGGQHINKTESAIRITHTPSGLVVACQEERSQVKNRAKAMKLLRSRLLEQMQAKADQEMSQNRRIQVGTGDRSEKIRTYNFPQDRITDHRINFSLHNLPAVMEGALQPLIEALQQFEKTALLAALSASPENI